MERLMQKILRMAFIFFSIIIFSSVNAANYKLGLESYKAGNYKKALSEWLPLAEQGHASAQYNLGVIYDNGRGVSQDNRKALKWYVLAANQGDPVAQKNVDHPQDEILDWNFKEKSAITFTFDLNNSMSNFITAEVAYSDNGERHIYFIFEGNMPLCEISDDQHTPEIDLWFFNNQAIYMSVWCRKYGNSEVPFVEFTPHSREGANFVISSFKNSVNPIAIKAGSINFRMSAKGFTKVWNSLSPKAL